MSNFSKTRKVFSLFFIPTIILLLAVFALISVNRNKIARGVSVANQNFSGASYEMARNKINAIIEKVANRPIEIKYADKQWSELPAKFGITFDNEATAKAAWQTSHNQNLWLELKQQISLIFIPQNLNISYQFDQAKLDAFMQDNLADLETPAKNATLKYQPATDDFSLVPSQDGQIFDRENLKNQIKQRVISFDQKPIILYQIIQKPILFSDINDMAATRAKNILDMTPYLLQYGNASWPIEKSVLVDWLNFEPDPKSSQTMEVAISQEAIKDFLAQLAPSINQEPINATLTLKDNRVQTFMRSQKGTELDIDQSAKEISQDILVGEKVINLQVDEKEPQITTETIDTLGITDLIGVGTSTFTGSTKNRIYNIGIGAEKINGVVVDPGQEFSIVETLGEIDASTGYRPELVIKNNQTIPEYGGGLCQVSTTLFRAAIYSGLKVTERYPHAFPVHYYNPQGFDATIYPPHPDMRFINDTPNHILIQSKIKGNVLTFEIYGTADGRQVKVDGPIILSSSPDGSMKTVLYQEVWRDGTLERKDTFRSNYKSPLLYPVVKNPLE